MSDHEPGTVALVTTNADTAHGGARLRALKRVDSRWVHQHGHHDADRVKDVTPLVCIEATREDADAVAATEAWLRSPSIPVSEETLALALAVMRDLADAIREQTPAPLVIPENLGAVVECSDGRKWFYPYREPGGAWATAELPGNWMLSMSRRNIADIAVRVLSEGVPS